MVRVCDRCGTVCSADQEWCLNCGVRMTEAGQRLPGLRAAGLVVALAVLLAGGAAAASYAALRGDARSAANVPSETAPGPVAAAPAPVAPVAPVAPAATTPTVPPATTTPTKPKKETAPATPSPSPSPSGGDTGSATPDPGTGGNSGSTTPRTTTTTPTTTTTRTTEDESGPVVFASGQGTIYDPKGVAADKGEEGNAIDGSTSSSWKVVLAPGQTGGLGYVLDFDDPTALKSLKVTSGTSGLKIKVLGTTKSALPPDELDSNWDTIASDRTLKSGSTTVPLKAVSGAKSKYRHVLVLFTTVPGSPATAVIREFVANR
jgi:hypothetical protein